MRYACMHASKQACMQASKQSSTHTPTYLQRRDQLAGRGQGPGATPAVLQALRWSKHSGTSHGTTQHAVTLLGQQGLGAGAQAACAAAEAPSPTRGTPPCAHARACVYVCARRRGAPAPAAPNRPPIMSCAHHMQSHAEGCVRRPCIGWSDMRGALPRHLRQQLQAGRRHIRPAADRPPRRSSSRLPALLAPAAVACSSSSPACEASRGLRSPPGEMT